MSDQKTIPKGLHNQEVKWGYTKKPSVLHIPVKSEIDTKVKGDPQTFKLKLNNKMTVNAAVWTGGGEESFLVHIMCVMSYCKRMDLFNKWKATKKGKSGFGGPTSTAWVPQGHREGTFPASAYWSRQGILSIGGSGSLPRHFDQQNVWEEKNSGRNIPLHPLLRPLRLRWMRLLGQK